MDLMKKGLLQPIDGKDEDDSISMGYSDAYYAYHQRRGHSIHFLRLWSLQFWTSLHKENILSPRFILMDLMKKGLLQPMHRKDEDDSM